MDEPVGRSIDGTPWEEARGPHLPDALTRLARRIPIVSWVFVAVAVINGAVPALDRSVSILSSPGLDAVTTVRVILGSILGITPAVATTLFGAAFFARHPRGWSTQRSVALGVSLIALGELMQTATSRLGDLFRTMTPPLDDVGLIAPSEIVYTILATVLIALGTLGVALGMRATPAPSDSPGGTRATRTMAIVVVLLAGWSIVVSIVAVIRYASPDTDAIYMAHAVIMTIVGWIPLAAQSYLAVVAVVGFAAGVRPVRAWWLASAGILTVLFLGNGVAVAADTVTYAVVTPQTDVGIWTWIYLVPAAGWALGYLLLLAAFVRGLPAIDETGDRPDPLALVHRQRRREVAQEVQALVDFLGRGIGSGHQETRTASHRHAVELPPVLLERPPGRDRRGALVDVDDRGRAPQGDLLPERPDAGPQVGIAGLVTCGRALEQIRDAVTGRDERIVCGLDRGARRQDPREHQSPPEGSTEAALVVVAGLDTDGRRIQPDEQEPVPQRWQIGQRLGRAAVDGERRAVRTGSGADRERGDLVGEHAVSPA